MRTSLLAIAAFSAAAAPPAEQASAEAPSPNAIVASAPADEWVAIAPEDLVVMDLAPAADGEERRVVIQLMPPPFSQGWVKNIRTLARAGWYDGVSVNRVQDNYVVQWGDATEEKPLPDGLRVMGEEDYLTEYVARAIPSRRGEPSRSWTEPHFNRPLREGPYGTTTFSLGFPIGRHIVPGDGPYLHPVHCYGMVGVGRDYSPDTGSGAELYTVIGHAPRHLDRNIALVGRVVEGIEHLSSLPRGTADFGFYEDPEQRVPIERVRLASDMPNPPNFEYLSTEGETFARYAETRANRRDPFFIVPAGGADICNIPVPVRRTN